ncbi:MAG TPA: hypothetical protein VMZ91_04220 [Candidatus Paceibacterota bacterium]|nr:hypothetical protein [Candidatus Paceibacterota bacterium]
MGSDDNSQINQRMDKKDLECVREELTCIAKQGTPFHKTFKSLLSYCLENKPKFEKWVKKQN